MTQQRTADRNYQTSVQRKMANQLGITRTAEPPAGTSECQASDSPPREKIRHELLQQGSRKPLRDLFQLDALITRHPEAGVSHVSVGTTDEVGDCLNCER